jgi:hypothetical protein
MLMWAGSTTDELGYMGEAGCVAEHRSLWPTARGLDYLLRWRGDLFCKRAAAAETAKAGNGAR